MRIIDAVWEKKNLGVMTKEIVVEGSDKVDDVLCCLKDIDAEYLVVKVPSDYHSISFELAKAGYAFIETMHHLSNDLCLKPLSERKKKIVDDTSIVPMDDMSFEYMCSRILDDMMFRTDRISRDPMFSPGQANQRYVNWLISEKERGTALYKLVHRGNYVGFICLQKLDNDVHNNCLYGIFDDHAGKGLSVCVSYKLNDIVKAFGGRKITTDISSANVKSLSAHINNGYVIDSSNYIFVRHKR